ncbi:MAG TPA: lysophospholipid acyltransferase family protein [Candidatus Limnocylindria bacterium]|nr:lysophospholipid acyltransferase family protein [Candidatus Limnocylindria bacterium]
MSADPARARRTGPREHSVVVTPRYRLMRWLILLAVGVLYRVRADGLDRWPEPPFLLLCNHHSGWDPMLVTSVVPERPRIIWFGPKEQDFSRGFKNRLMRFFGGVIPYNPEKTTLVSAVRAVRRVFDARGVLGIFAEGRVGFRESELLPFEEGAVAFASAAGVPIVPCAIVGSADLWFRCRVTVRFGEPIATGGFRGAPRRAELEERARAALSALLPGREPPLPAFRPLASIGEVLDGRDDRDRRRRERPRAERPR